MSVRTENPELAFCIRNKILVYPVICDSKKKTYQIEVSFDGKKHKFKKIINSSEINNAMTKTHKYYYDKYKNAPNMR